MLIGLTGHARAGKDTVASILRNYHGMTTFAIADPIKDLLLTLDPLVSGATSLRTLVEKTGWERAKTDRVAGSEVRRLMQIFGHEVAKSIGGPEVWLDVLARRVENCANCDIVVSDVRLADEAAWVRQRGGVIWRIKRAAAHGSDHVTESQIDQLAVDHVIVNDGDISALIQDVGESLASLARTTVRALERHSA